MLAHNYGKGVKWLPGVVIAQTELSYTVELADGNLIWKRHVDQLLTTNSCDSSEEQATTNPYLEIALDYHQLSRHSSAPTFENALTETHQGLTKSGERDCSKYKSVNALVKPNSREKHCDCERTDESAISSERMSTS